MSNNKIKVADVIETQQDGVDWCGARAAMDIDAKYIKVQFEKSKARPSAAALAKRARCRGRE